MVIEFNIKVRGKQIEFHWYMEGAERSSSPELQ
jgi:hypothetical protein